MTKFLEIVFFFWKLRYDLKISDQYNHWKPFRNEYKLENSGRGLNKKNLHALNCDLEFGSSLLCIWLKHVPTFATHIVHFVVNGFLCDEVLSIYDYIAMGFFCSLNIFPQKYLFFSINIQNINPQKKLLIDINFWR